METTIDRPVAVYTDTAGAATILCVAPKTLRNWASLGAGPEVFRLNGATRYSIEGVLAWAAERRVAA